MAGPVSAVLLASDSVAIGGAFVVTPDDEDYHTLFMSGVVVGLRHAATIAVRMAGEPDASDLDELFTGLSKEDSNLLLAVSAANHAMAVELAEQIRKASVEVMATTWPEPNLNQPVEMSWAAD